MMYAVPGTLSLVLTTAEARLGLVFLDMKKAAPEASRIL